MRQYVLPASYDRQTEITVTDRDYHYLVRVLRLREGDTFAGIDKQGNRYQVTINAMDNTTCTLSVTPLEDRKSSFPRITLFQAIPKGKSLDLIIRQAVEMGVSSLYPVASDYSIPKMEQATVTKKQKRWARIVEEAVQQSGSSIFTTVNNPISLTTVARQCNTDQPALFFHQQQLEQTTLHHLLAGNPQEVSLLIGPEGGFSDNEVDYLQTNNFRPVCLQTNVLRTETAAVYAVAAVQIILSERNSWQLHP